MIEVICILKQYSINFDKKNQLRIFQLKKNGKN